MINEQHVSNFAAKDLVGAKLLHKMHEDKDVEGQEEVTDLLEWFDTLAPGKIMVLYTGDYIVPDCGRNYDAPPSHWREHQRCEMYDATYCVYALPYSDWESQASKIMKIDREWREDAKKCKVPTSTAPSQETALVEVADELPF